MQQEKKRVEDFQYLYKITITIASVSFLLAISFFVLTDNYILKALPYCINHFAVIGLVVAIFQKNELINITKTS